MLSDELLRALLSPDAGIRGQAETAFRSIAVPERVQALTNILLTATAATDSDSHSVSMLIAVLLRRDILKLTDSSLLSYSAIRILPMRLSTRRLLSAIASLKFVQVSL
jgi:hypothetical protein